MLTHPGDWSRPRPENLSRPLVATHDFAAELFPGTFLVVDQAPWTVSFGPLAIDWISGSVTTTASAEHGKENSTLATAMVTIFKRTSVEERKKNTSNFLVLSMYIGSWSPFQTFQFFKKFTKPFPPPNFENQIWILCEVPTFHGLVNPFVNIKWLET